MHQSIESNDKTLQGFAFEIMNTTVDVLFWGRDKDIHLIKGSARHCFSEAEKRFSRFQPESELSQLNRAAGQPSLISKPMLEVLLESEMYGEITGGVFNPLIAKALQQVGYDKSFDLVKKRALFNHSRLAFSNPYFQGKLIINPVDRILLIPPQMEIDLGGIIKSWTVRNLANLLKKDFGLSRGLINAGGDLYVWGNSSPGGDPWCIEIENPWAPDEDLGMIFLSEDSIATSSKLGRTWATNQGKMHHLINPRTMLPSRSDVVQCTVRGKDTVECEIWAKVICILGSKEGPALFRKKAPEYEALVFTDQRNVLYYGKRGSIGSNWSGIPIDKYKY